MKYVLVTGGAGYIGSYICKLFYDKGYIPVTFDNLSLGNKWSVKWGPLEVGELCSENDLQKLFEKYNFIGVIHLAALSNVSESVNDPSIYYKNNVIGSYNLIEKMIKFNVKNIVFSSTAAVYGNPIHSPICENHPTQPINPYGDSKLTIERLICNYSKCLDLNFVILRYFNVSGSDFSNNLGEAHLPETHLIPLALEAAYQNSIFKIYGDNYKTTDGTCIRDFIHVKDVGNVHLLSFEKLNSSKVNQIINVGGGKGYTVYEIIKYIKKITNLDLKTDVIKRRKGDPDILVSDIRKSKNILSWEPMYSDVEQVISDSWEWYKYYKNLSQS